VVPYSSVMATPIEPCQRAGGPFKPFDPAPITILFLDPQHVVPRSIDTARAGIDVPDSSRTLSIVSFHCALWGSGGEAPSTGVLTCRQFKRHSISHDAAEDVTPSRSAGEAVRTDGRRHARRKQMPSLSVLVGTIPWSTWGSFPSPVPGHD